MLRFLISGFGLMSRLYWLEIFRICCWVLVRSRCRSCRGLLLRMMFFSMVRLLVSLKCWCIMLMSVLIVLVGVWKEICESSILMVFLLGCCILYRIFIRVDLFVLFLLMMVCMVFWVICSVMLEFVTMLGKCLVMLVSLMVGMFGVVVIVLLFVLGCLFMGFFMCLLSFVVVLVRMMRMGLGET